MFFELWTVFSVYEHTVPIELRPCSPTGPLDNTAIQILKYNKCIQQIIVGNKGDRTRLMVIKPCIYTGSLCTTSWSKIIWKFFFSLQLPKLLFNWAIINWLISSWLLSKSEFWWEISCFWYFTDRLEQKLVVFKSKVPRQINMDEWLVQFNWL